MNNYSEFQVNIFSNNKDIRLHLENSKSKKGHNFVKRIGGLPPILVWIPLLIVSNYSEFQVNIFRNSEILENVKVSARRRTTTPPTKTPGCLLLLKLANCKSEQILMKYRLEDFD